MMNIFFETASRLEHYKDIKNCLLKGYTPAAVTGVSGIHKAMLTAALSSLGCCLLICADEADATKMCADMNEMAGEEISCVYPAKDMNFAYMEGISREYEHRRIAALSDIMSGRCRIMAASMEACLQGTIPPAALKEYTFTIQTGSELDTAALQKTLIASGYTKTDQVEGTAQFAVRGSIIDVFPVQERQPVRIELWGDEVDSVAYFDIESQRRGEGLEQVTIAPALEIIFPAVSEQVRRMEELAKSARGKLTDKIRENIQKDIDLLESGIMLTDLDKYYTLAYSETATVFDYFGGGFCAVSE